MLAILGVGSVVTAVGGLAAAVRKAEAVERAGKRDWRMPALGDLAPAQMSKGRRLWMSVLRGYLLAAGGLVLVRIVQLALNHNAVGGV